MARACGRSIVRAAAARDAASEARATPAQNLAAHEILEVELVVAVPARAPDLDAARVVGADLAVGALVRGRRVGGRVRPKRRKCGRVLRRAAERVQYNGEEGITLWILGVLPTCVENQPVSRVLHDREDGHLALVSSPFAPSAEHALIKSRDDGVNPMQ